MTEGTNRRSEVDTFIRDKIDTVPHMEALLLLWETRPREWTEAELAERLFTTGEVVRRIALDLAEHNLTEGDNGQMRYSSSPERDELIEAVAQTYRRELVRVSEMIHSKAPGSVRAFARAFRFGKKE